MQNEAARPRMEMVKLFKKDMKETDEVAESIAKMRAMAGVGSTWSKPAYMKAKKDTHHTKKYSG